MSFRGRLLVAGTFSSRFAEPVGVPPSTYRRHATRARAGMPSCVGGTGDQTDQESRSADPPTAASVTVMDITIHGTFLPHDDPDASLAVYRDQVVPVRAGPIKTNGQRRNPSAAIGLSISGLPVRL
jgi:hypothetical protein